MGADVQARVMDIADVHFGADGLVASVAQDADDGRVLMVAWQDREALEATLRSGEAHFHSRTRGTLWRKGETSGNTLRVVDVQLDCDGDAVLMRVEPRGPACHTDARSCFDPAPTPTPTPVPVPATATIEPTTPTDQGFDWLERLWATIAERAEARPAGSYTARLLDQGVDGPARKVAEEAIEVVMAAKDDAASATKDPERPERKALAGEVADLLYHVLVLCAERDLPPSQALDVLRARHRA